MNATDMDPIADDERQATTWLHTTGAANPDTLARAMREEEAPPIPAEGAPPIEPESVWRTRMDAVFARNLARWLAAFKAGMRPRILRTPGMAPFLRDYLTNLAVANRQEFERHETIARSFEAQLLPEAEARPLGWRIPWRKARSAEEPVRTQADRVIDTMIDIFQAPAQLEALRQAREARKRADSYGAAGWAIVHAVHEIDQFCLIRDGLLTARDELAAELTAERDAAVRALRACPLPNDLPPLLETEERLALFPRIAGSLARAYEPSGTARARGMAAIDALIERADPNLPVTTAALRAWLAADLGPCLPDARDLPGAMMLAAKTPADAVPLVERLIGALMTDGFVTQTEVALSLAARGYARRYLFEIVPPGQRALNLEPEGSPFAPEVATFARTTRATRRAYAQVATNFPLEDVDAYRVIAPVLASAQAEINHFCLPGASARFAAAFARPSTQAGGGPAAPPPGVPVAPAPTPLRGLATIATNGATVATGS